MKVGKTVTGQEVPLLKVENFENNQKKVIKENNEIKI